MSLHAAITPYKCVYMQLFCVFMQVIYAAGCMQQKMAVILCRGRKVQCCSQLLKIRVSKIMIFSRAGVRVTPRNWIVISK